MLERRNLALEAYQVNRLEGFKAENQTLSPGGVVFVGDSITEFFPLKKYLSRDLPLVNRGIAGTDTKWLLEHLTDQVLALDPDKIFLMIGVNDFGWGYPIADIVGRISQLISQIRAEAVFTKIYLLSVLPVNASPEFAGTVKVRNNRDIQQLNQDLQVLGGVEFIDLYPLLLDDQGNLALDYTTDGLHLSQAAYAKLGQALLPYVQE